jgi:uncharacterized protein
MTREGKRKLSLLGPALGLVWWAAAAAAAPPTMNLKVDGHPVTAEIAATDDLRMLGLMYRNSLPSEAGMLFVYDEPGYYAMWMKNTLIPLSVAFIDERGRIVNIEEMKPQTLDPHGSAGIVRYSLEMNAGWFARNGVKAGAVITGLPPPPKAR